MEKSGDEKEDTETEGDAAADEDFSIIDQVSPIIKPDVNVDSMLAYVGDFGRYQILLMVLFSMVNVFSAFHYFAQTFITIEPENFRCAMLAENDHENDDNFYGLVNAGPPGNETRPQSPDKCKEFNLDLVEFVENNNDTQRNTIWKLEDCKKFKYDKDFGYESIVTELEWVCNKSWKAAIGQSMYFVGSVFGTFLLGIAADSWGRTKALVIAYLFAIFGNTMTIFSYDLELFAVARFIAGLATDTNFVMMYIIVMEYVRPSMRTFGLNVCIGIFYCLGCSVVPWLAVALQTWRRFLIAVSVGMILTPFYYFILPESASWLLTQGRVDEALKGFQRIAKINGKTIPDEVIATFKEVHENDDKPPKAAICELFRTPKLRRKMCILIFKTMTLTLCYDAISRNVNVNGASPFLVFSLGSLTIFPAGIVILLLQDKIGRKALFFLAVLMSAFLTSSCGLMNAFVKNTTVLSQQTIVRLSVGLTVTARLCVVVAFNSGSQYAAELIPTVIRGRGVALIHVVGYAASFMSPLILYLIFCSAHYASFVQRLLFFFLKPSAKRFLLPSKTGKNLGRMRDPAILYAAELEEIKIAIN
ncbi:organic cation transporter-like protein isoform X2 [Athalia rosae]|uniref:organic cation transporter-like protein isoform X2 n=1 Tax=Athalia rosae TaxID=37344 RepID=UPI0020343D71|nr:organic cation transporter-like protein isoform X2 [Athalia rosae]